MKKLENTATTTRGYMAMPMATAHSFMLGCHLYFLVPNYSKFAAKAPKPCISRRLPKKMRRL